MSDTAVQTKEFKELTELVETLSDEVKKAQEEGSSQSSEHKEKIDAIQKTIAEIEAKVNYAPRTPEHPTKLRRFKGKQADYDELIRLADNTSMSREETGLVEDLKRVSDDCLLLWHCRLFSQKHYDTDEGKTPQELLMSLKATDELVELQKEVRKAAALDTATAGEGLEWIPTGFSSQITELTEQELRVAALYDSFDMPSDPYEWPFATENIQSTRVGQATAVPATNLAGGWGFGTDFTDGKPTGKVTFASAKMRSNVLLSGEFDEDSIRTALPWVRAQLGKAHARAIEDGMVNGDDGAAHFDADITEWPTGTSANVLWEGLRHYVLTLNTTPIVAGGGDTGGNIHNLIPDCMKLMGGEYGSKPDDLALIISHRSWANWLKNTNVLTLDKLGTKATILRGQLGAIFGIPIIVSQYMRDDVDTMGAFSTGTDGVATSALLSWRPGWKLGVRRRPSFEAVRIAPQDQEYMVSFMRADFEEMHDTNQKIVGLIRNLGL